MGRLPESVYNELVAEGHVYIGPIPGAVTPEAVFGPGPLGRLNESMQWWIVDPYEGVR